MKYFTKQKQLFQTLALAYTGVFALTTVMHFVTFSSFLPRWFMISQETGSVSIYFMFTFYYIAPILLFAIAYALSPFKNYLFKLLTAVLASASYNLLPVFIEQIPFSMWLTPLFGSSTYQWAQFLGHALTLFAIIGIIAWYKQAKKYDLHISNKDPLVIGSTLAFIYSFLVQISQTTTTFTYNIGARSNTAEYWFILPMIAFLAGCILFYKRTPRYWLFIGLVVSAITGHISGIVRTIDWQPKLPMYADIFVSFMPVIVLICALYVILYKKSYTNK